MTAPGEYFGTAPRSKREPLPTFAVMSVVYLTAPTQADAIERVASLVHHTPGLIRSEVSGEEVQPQEQDHVTTANGQLESRSAQDATLRFSVCVPHDSRFAL